MLAVDVLEQPPPMEHAVDHVEVEVVPEHEERQLQRDARQRAHRKHRPHAGARADRRDDAVAAEDRDRDQRLADLAPESARARARDRRCGRPRPRAGKARVTSRCVNAADGEVDEQETAGGDREDQRERKRARRECRAGRSRAALSAPEALQPEAGVPSGPRAAGGGALVLHQHGVQHLGAEPVQHQAEAGAQRRQRHPRVAVVDQREVRGVAAGSAPRRCRRSRRAAATGWRARSHAAPAAGDRAACRARSPRSSRGS